MIEQLEEIEKLLGSGEYKAALEKVITLKARLLSGDQEDE